MDNNYVLAKYKLGHCCDVFYQENISGNKALVRKCKIHTNQFFPLEEGLQIRTEYSKKVLQKRAPSLFQDKLI